MSGAFKQVIKVDKSENKLFHKVVKPKALIKNNIKNNVVLKKAMIGSTRNPAIIRIVPTKRINLLTKDVVKTLVVQKPNGLNVENLPSTSNKSSTDCEYITTKNEPQFLDNSTNEFEEFNGNSESAAEEINEPKLFKQKSNHDIIKTQIDNNKSVGDLLNKTHSDNCCCSCKEMLNVILQQQNQILNILQNGLSTSGKEKIKFDLLPPMPFKDINDFLDFDESLVNENVQDQFGAKLKKLLGSTEQKSVTNMMSSVMTNELCKTISWIGIKDTIAFGNTNMVTLIVDLVQEHHQLEIDVVKSRIAEWLRRCGDRINNEIRKNKKRAEQGYSV